MRAAFDHLARNPDLGLARVVASFLVPPARVLGDAAALERFGLVLLREPVGGPLPDVANHVVEAVAIRREGPDSCGALIGAVRCVPVRELALPRVRHLPPAGRELVAPGELATLKPAARR